MGNVNEEENERQVPPTSACRLKTGSSDSISSNDSLEQRTSECSSRGELGECSSSLEPNSPPSKTFDPESQSDNAQRHGFFRLLKKRPKMRFQPILSVNSVPKLTRRNSKRYRENQVPPLNSPLNNPALTTILDTELFCFKASWKNFSYAEIVAATNNFSHEKVIGQGGYAVVYKGKMEDGQFVAIKQLTRGTLEEMTADFLSELGIIVHVNHPNIARLIGYGVEGGMFLVLLLSPHGSLASILYCLLTLF